MARSPRTVFLDAIVLAAPVTRTLLLVGVEAIDAVARWSAHAELEANKHLRSRAMSVTDVRVDILEADLSPTGANPRRFVSTGGADGQVLADAAAAGAGYLVTSDVDDFAKADLAQEGVVAVNPDLFMALRFSGSAYQRALAQLVASLNNPPKTIEEMHVLIGRKHRRLHRRFAALYPGTKPLMTPEHEQRVLYRGATCVACGRTARDPRHLELGCHRKCLPATT